MKGIRKRITGKKTPSGNQRGAGNKKDGKKDFKMKGR